MRRRSLFMLVGVGVLLAVLGGVLARGSLPRPTRAERIKQSQWLGDRISLQIDELFVLPTNGHTMLAVSGRYVGGNPARHHLGLQKTLLVSPGGPLLPYGDCVEAASPFQAGPGFPFLWLFRFAPEHCDQFTMRVAVSARQQDVRFVDFNLPNLPVPYH